MARILIADTADGAVCLSRILKGHKCVVVTTMKRATEELDGQSFDLIVAGLHFDDSQMFELIRTVRRMSPNEVKPIICFCSKVTRMTQLMHESLEFATNVLGAWMYLDEHSYNVYQDPDAELRRVMERCLTEESRKEIQKRRLDVQGRRTEVQQIRTLLQSQEWSLEMKVYLAGLKHDLELLLAEVAQLQSVVTVERARTAASRDLKDRVADHVRTNENTMTVTEDAQMQVEVDQAAAEERLSSIERIREGEAHLLEN